MGRAAHKPAPLSLRGYARHRGVTLAAVQKAIASGRLDRALLTLGGGARRIDPEVADIEWGANTDPSQRRSDEPEGAATGQGTLFEGANEPPADAARGGAAPAISIQEAKRIQTLLKSRLLTLDLAERQGRLSDRATFESVALESGAAVRRTIMAVPAQVRAELAAATDPHRVQQLLEAALERALAEIAAMYRKQIKRPSKVA